MYNIKPLPKWLYEILEEPETPYGYVRRDSKFHFLSENIDELNQEVMLGVGCLPALVVPKGCFAMCISLGS